MKLISTVYATVQQSTHKLVISLSKTTSLLFYLDQVIAGTNHFNIKAIPIPYLIVLILKHSPTGLKMTCIFSRTPHFFDVFSQRNVKLTVA